MPSESTYSQTTAQFTNSGFVPIAKPLISKLPERYDTPANDYQQVDPGLELTRMGYTNGEYEFATGLGSTNNNLSPSVYSSQTARSLINNLKQEAAVVAQDSAAQQLYDLPSMTDRSLRYSDKYNNYLQGNGANEEFTVNSQTSAESSRQNFLKQLSSDVEVAKFLKSAATEQNEEIVSPEQTESADTEPNYGDRNQQQEYQRNKMRKPSYQVMSEEQQLFSPEIANQIMKNFAQPSDIQTNSLSENNLQHSSPSTESEIQSLINQLLSSANSNPSHYDSQKSHSDLLANLQQEFQSSNLADLSNFGTSHLENPHSLSPLNGIQGFSPTTEGGQLPAPHGYKHVGYITIPAGSANVPNMLGTPAAGLPIIRPMPLVSGSQSAPNAIPNQRLPIGMNPQKHVQSFQEHVKKHNDQMKQASESKPRRTFLSRWNPLNMLRRLRQRRERRQTNDLISPGGMNDLLPMSGYGFGGGGYGMPPLMSGGISGLGGMYASMSNPSPVYAGMGGYGPQMGPYSGYGGYPGYGYGYAPTNYGQQQSGGSEGSKGESSESSSSSNSMMSGTPSDGNSQSSGPMPMMMPYNPMGAYSPLGPMAMGSMPMPYGFAPQQQSSSSSSSSSSTQEQSGISQLPGGFNLSDLLKDEEDEEPSRFRRFLSYLNPMNLFRRFRDRNSTQNDERKRFGRFRRDISDENGSKSTLHFPESYSENTSDESNPRASRVLFLKRSGRKSRIRFPRNDGSDANNYNETKDINNNKEKKDKLDLSDSGLHALSDSSEENNGRGGRSRFTHRRSRRPNGQQRTHFSNDRQLGLMGSGNFEVIRGGAFKLEEASGSHPLRDDGSIYDGENSGSVFSALEDEFFDSANPEVLGFQGFNGFGSMYNSLSASNKIPKLMAADKRRDLIGNIENAALTTTELKATS